MICKCKVTDQLYFKITSITEVFFHVFRNFQNNHFQRSLGERLTHYDYSKIQTYCWLMSWTLFWSRKKSLLADVSKAKSLQLYKGFSPHFVVFLEIIGRFFEESFLGKPWGICLWKMFDFDDVQFLKTVLPKLSQCINNIPYLYQALLMKCLI